MSTEQFFINDCGIELDTFICLSSDDLSVVKSHVEITRHLIEIHELYLLFKFHLDNIQKQYILMNDGNVLKNGNPADSVNDYIAINAYIISIISSGRSLIESMEVYVKRHLNCDDELPKSYLEYYHKIYDSSFNYRLLIRLRDYSQHGHLPINKDGFNYCINLYNVLHTPHYNHNGKIKNEIDSIAEEIINVYADTPTISLTMAISDFTVQLLSIYNKFWITVDSMVRDSTILFKVVAEANKKNTTNNMFFYEIVDGNAHCIPVRDDPIKMLLTNKSEANDILREYTDASDTLKKGIVTISVSKNKQQIEIGQF